MALTHGKGTVKGYKIGPNADLRGADLRGADLRGAILVDADLTEANLRGADLSDADLTGAILFEADLSNTDLICAILVEADLTNADLSGADLTDADLTDADFSNAFVDPDHIPLIEAALNKMLTSLRVSGDRATGDRNANPADEAAPREYYRDSSLPVSTPTRAARLSVSMSMKKLVGFAPELTVINEDGSARYWAEWPNGTVGRLPKGTFPASKKKIAYNSIYLSTVSRPTRSDRLMVSMSMEELVGFKPELTVINEDGSARYWAEFPNGKVGRLPKGTFDADFPSGRRYPRHR